LLGDPIIYLLSWLLYVGIGLLFNTLSSLEKLKRAVSLESDRL